jgi:hypothetical protein
MMMSKILNSKRTQKGKKIWYIEGKFTGQDSQIESL